MRRFVTSVALLGAVLAPISLTPLLAQAATTALILGGSGQGDPTALPNYVPNVEKYYISPNSTCQPTVCELVPVVYPGGVIPPFIGTTPYDLSVAEGVLNVRTALDSHLADHPNDPVVIFGYSQSANVVAKTLREFAADPTAAPSTDQVSFVVIGNPNRPNGGLLARMPVAQIPILNIGADGAMPTDTGYHTTDIAFRYDPIADFPQYPLNLLADLNSVFGFFTAHMGYPNPYQTYAADLPIFATTLPNGYTEDELHAAMNDPANRQTYGDTTYITIAPTYLPILQPLVDIGFLTGTSALINPIVDLVQPTLTTIIELGYDRTIPYGQPTTFGLLPKLDPAAVPELKAAKVKPHRTATPAAAVITSTKPGFAHATTSTRAAASGPSAKHSRLH